MAGNEIEIYGRMRHWLSEQGELESINPLLKEGEIVIVDDLNNSKKIGDGVHTYKELPFDTNHQRLAIEENVATVTLYNVIQQTTFVYRRSASSVTDVIFLLDSFKDSNRGFGQLDGRTHKIYVENSYSSSFDVEIELSSQEVSEGSNIVQFGTISIPANSFLVIEFSWFTNFAGTKVCNICIQDASFFYKHIQNTSGAITLYNEERRQYHAVDFTISGSTMTISISKNNSITGSLTKSKVAHYCVVKNIAATTKTVVIQCANSGVELVSESVSAISLDSAKSFEFSYIWIKKGTTDVCVLTKSNILNTTVY